MPQRIQRKRTKGWRMPEGTVYVGRGTRYGNPWRIGEASRTPSWEMTAEKVVSNYKSLLEIREANYIRGGRKRKFEGLPYYDDIQEALRGKNLACWCAIGQPCHADILLEIANR